MKINNIITSLLISSLLLACNVQNSSHANSKHELIMNLINTPELTSAKSNGKLIILQTKYCKDFDCKVYFHDYQEQIQIHSREDAFMRAIKNYLEIESIDEENGQITLSKRGGKEIEKIEIKL